MIIHNNALNYLCCHGEHLKNMIRLLYRVKQLEDIKDYEEIMKKCHIKHTTLSGASIKDTIELAVKAFRKEYGHQPSLSDIRIFLLGILKGSIRVEGNMCEYFGPVGDYSIYETGEEE